MEHITVEQFGPWGYLIATCLLTISVSIAGAITYLAKKTYGGFTWLSELLQRAADKHFAFMDMLASTQSSINANLEHISKTETEASEKLGKIEVHAKETADKVRGWDSDSDGVCQVAHALREAGIKDITDEELNDAVNKVREVRKQRVRKAHS